MPDTFAFDLPQPHSVTLCVDERDIDAYEHVNNAVYVTWCDRTAWDHSAKLGLPVEKCLELDRGMAVVRTLITYLRPALQGDQLTIATWLLPSQRRSCVRRRFQIVRPVDQETLARAEVEYACIELSTGKPTRWPLQFRESYVTVSAVVAAFAELQVL